MHWSRRLGITVGACFWGTLVIGFIKLISPGAFVHYHADEWRRQGLSPMAIQMALNKRYEANSSYVPFDDHTQIAWFGCVVASAILMAYLQSRPRHPSKGFSQAAPRPMQSQDRKPVVVRGPETTPIVRIRFR